MAWHAGMPFIFDWHGMAWHGMFWVDGGIESTKTRVNPGFFRGTPPENRGSPHVFSRLPGFFPGIPGG